MSTYQSLKLFLTDISGYSRDSFHIILGFLVFLLVSYLFKLKLSSFKTLIAPILFALLLEFLDIRDALVFGFNMDLYASLRDIVITTLLPLVVVVYTRFFNRK